MCEPDLSQTEAGESGVSDEAIQTPTPRSPAWERRDELGVLRALAQTAFDIARHRTHAFQTMSLDGGLASPLLYAFCGIGLWLGGGFLLRSSSTFFLYLLEQESGIEPIQELLWFEAGVTVWVLVCLGELFPLSALVYGVHRFLCQPRLRFEAVLRVVCYSAGTCAVLALFPVCGLELLGLAVRFVLGENSWIADGVGLLLFCLFLCSCAFFFVCCTLGFVHSLKLDVASALVLVFVFLILHVNCIAFSSDGLEVAYHFCCAELGLLPPQ